MLLLGERLLGTPVMSLQTGSKVAETSGPVINPRNLTIVAYEVDGDLLDVRPSYLRIADIRELSDLGMIIDHSDEFIGQDDVIKIKELIDLNFDLVNMRVIDARGKKLGKVADYTIDTDSFTIQQLSVKAGLISSLSSTGHMIHRSQITKITDTTIYVKSADKHLTSLETTGNIHRTYNNPFRKSQEPQPEAIVKQG